MNKKRPYLREVSVWESEKVKTRWESQKSVINKKKKKKPTQVGGELSATIDHHNKIMRDAILQKMTENEQKYNTHYDSTIYKIKTSIIFSKSYTLTMTLPSTMRLNELQDLIGCYVKLHLKHRPSEEHVYVGLEGNNINCKKQKQQQVKSTEKLKSQQQITSEEQQQQSLHLHLASQIITSITDSLLLSQHTLYQKQTYYSQQQLSSQTAYGTLMQMVIMRRLVKKRVLQVNKRGIEDNNGDQCLLSYFSCEGKDFSEEISLLVRYDNHRNSNNNHHTATISNQNNHHLLTLDPNQQSNRSSKQIITLSPKHSLVHHHINLHHKQLQLSSSYHRLVGWFTETSMIQWLVIKQLILNNNKKQLFKWIRKNKQQQQQQSSIIIPSISYSAKRRKHFISLSMKCQQQQSHPSCKLAFHIYPVRLNDQKVQKIIYHIATISWYHNTQPQHISDKLQLIKKQLIQQSDLPLTHHIKQMYTVTQIDKQVEVENQQPNYSHQQYVHQFSNCLIIVFETLHFRTITFKEYLNHLLDKLREHIESRTSNNTMRIQQTHKHLLCEITRILSIVKSICIRIVVMSYEQNHFILSKKSKQNMNIPLLQSQSILDIFSILISPSSNIAQVLVDSIAVTNLICGHSVVYANDVNGNQRRGRRRRGDGCNVNDVTTSNHNVSIEINKQQENINLSISQRLNQQVSIIVSQLSMNASTRQYLNKLLAESFLSIHNNPYIMSPFITMQQNHNLQYLTLIIDQIHRQCEQFLSTISDTYTQSNSKTQSTLSLHQNNLFSNNNSISPVLGNFFTAITLTYALSAFITNLPQLFSFKTNTQTSTKNKQHSKRKSNNLHITKITIQKYKQKIPITQFDTNFIISNKNQNYSSKTNNKNKQKTKRQITTSSTLRKK